MHSITKMHTRKRLHETAAAKTSVNFLPPSCHLASSWENKSTLQCEFTHRVGVARVIVFKWRHTRLDSLRLLLLSAGNQRFF